MQHLKNFVLNMVFIATECIEELTFGRNQIEKKVKLITIACRLQVRTPYRPVEAKLEPLSAGREKLPNGRLMEHLHSIHFCIASFQ